MVSLFPETSTTTMLKYLQTRCGLMCWNLSQTSIKQWQAIGPVGPGCQHLVQPQRKKRIATCFQLDPMTNGALRRWLAPNFHSAKHTRLTVHCRTEHLGISQRMSTSFSMTAALARKPAIRNTRATSHCIMSLASNHLPVI
jgi:hypothetical protein